MIRRTSTWALCLWLLGVALQTDPPRAADAGEAYRAGRRALDARDYERAITSFREALDADPGHVGARLNLGIAYSATSRWDEAIAAYREVLAREPGHAKANNNLGNVYFRQGRYDEAKRYYREAVDTRRDYLLPWYHLGWIARHENESDLAERCFRRCIDLPPKTRREAMVQEDARFYLGALRFRARDFEETVKLMRRVLQGRPDHLEAHYYIGQALARLGRREEARPHLELHRRLVEARRSRDPVASGGR